MVKVRVKVMVMVPCKGRRRPRNNSKRGYSDSPETIRGHNENHQLPL